MQVGFAHDDGQDPGFVLLQVRVDLRFQLQALTAVLVLVQPRAAGHGQAQAHRELPLATPRHHGGVDAHLPRALLGLVIKARNRPGIVFRLPSLDFARTRQGLSRAVSRRQIFGRRCLRRHACSFAGASRSWRSIGSSKPRLLTGQVNCARYTDSAACCAQANLARHLAAFPLAQTTLGSAYPLDPSIRACLTRQL